MKVFLNRMLVVFLARVSPVSTMAKPKCMMKTRPAANIIQTLLATKVPCDTPSSAKATAGARRAPAARAPVKRESFRVIWISVVGFEIVGVRALPLP
jgi:hypothetical protein